MKRLPNTKQEYQIARIVAKVAAEPEKYKEVAVYTLTEVGYKNYKDAASKFIIANDWLLEEDEMYITIWTGTKLKFVGLGEVTNIRKIKVDDMYDIGYIDEWSKV